MNPYRLVEKVLKILGWIFVGVLLLGTLAIVSFQIYETDGWWVLLIVPGWFIGFALIFIGMLLLGYLGITIEEKWKSARYRWENKRRSNKDD